MHSRFEPPNENWKPYTPGRREFANLSPELKAQLEKVPPSSDGRIQYWPCYAALKDGRKFENVYVMDAQNYISKWGVWPDDDSGKRSVPINQVLSLGESPNRLPASAADKLYCAGESGMGYTVFSVKFRDGTIQAHISGNAVDFVRYPSGKSAIDVATVIPHQGRNDPAALQAPDYFWCLHGSGESDSKSWRWAG